MTQDEIKALPLSERLAALKEVMSTLKRKDPVPINIKGVNGTWELDRIETIGLDDNVKVWKLKRDDDA